MNLRNIGKLVLASTLFAIAPAFHVHAETIQVIDGSTGKPLAGVHVVAAWDGSIAAIVESKHACFRVDAAVSGRDGKFSIPSRPGNGNPRLTDRQRTLTFYKRGYKGPPLPPDDGVRTVAMTPDESAGLERLRYIGFAANGASCGSMERQRAVALPFRRAIYEESKDIAKTPEELGWVDGALFYIEVLKFGEAKALEMSARRRLEWGIK